MSELPSYYHLSPKQIDELSFRVTVRYARCSGGGAPEEVLVSKDIAWQEKIPKRTDARNRPVCIYTFTNADVIPFGVKLPGVRTNDLQIMTSDSRFSLKNDLHQHAKSTLQIEKNDRLFREDLCQLMVIMAANCAQHSTQSQDEVLCAIKVYPNTGLVSSFPAWSEVESDDYDYSSVFMSNRSLEDVFDKGARLTTYSFILAGSVYEYAIEWNGVRSIGDETELMIDQQHIIDKEADDERRDLIRKEFDPYDCMHEKKGYWSNHAQIELVSANGFSVPNLLLCMPHGPSIEVRYRVIKRKVQDHKDDDVIIKGATASVQSYSPERESLEFVTNFVVAFVGVAFALLLLLSYTGGDVLRSVMISIVPIVLVFNATITGDTTPWPINHQFTLLYDNNEGVKLPKDINRRYAESSLNLVLELRVYLKQNFGLISLVGCGTVDLPTEPGEYDVHVKNWKPIADTHISESRARMHDFYLGSCLSEIGPLDPAPTSGNESAIVGGTDATLFSKGGLLADYSGNVHARITVSRLDWLRKSSDWKAEDYKHNRVKMRETVDEVISRVRRNKRGRMSRVHTSSVLTSTSLNASEFAKRRLDSDAPTKDETKNIIDGKFSNRTAEVLERVKSRKA